MDILVCTSGMPYGYKFFSPAPELYKKSLKSSSLHLTKKRKRNKTKKHYNIILQP
jgi:hypothetical protein